MTTERQAPQQSATADNVRLETRSSPTFTLVLASSLSVLVLAVGTAIALVPLDQIVAVSGQLTPTRRTQTITSAEAGTVEAVLVREGDTVQPGQTLIRLSPQVASNTVRELKRELLAGEALQQSERQRLVLQLGSLERLLHLQEQVFKPLQTLARQGGAPALRIVEQQQQLEQTRGQIAQTRQQLNSLSFQAAQARAQLQRELLNAERRLELVTIKAPTAGSVLDLKALTGQVINPGDSLLKLVPRAGLQAIVQAPNQTISLIRAGQSARIAIQAYDPSLYGLLPARVSQVGTDALPATEAVRYPHFPVTLTLEQPFLSSRGQRFELQAGMAITAQIKLQRRTLLQLLFSGFQQGLTSVRTLR
jgi:multidrug efflux pump subunit AcrA (membrane-fusion protein)